MLLTFQLWRYLMANRYYKGGNWSNINSWSATVDGAGGASVPTSSDNVYWNSVPDSATYTVDAVAYCLAMDWTGATNTPTLAGGSSLNIYGNVTFILAMVYSHTSELAFLGNSSTFTSNGLTIGASGTFTPAKTAGQTITLTDNITTGKIIYHFQGEFDTASKTVNCAGYLLNNANTRVLTLGASVLNLTGSWDTNNTNNITANTATINVTGTGAVTLGTADYNGASFNLNGTAHTVSGNPTGINVFTRNGTATNANTMTLTSGATLTCTTFAMIGNSRANQLLVQSSTLGTAATITATNWTGTNNVDLMDITATNAVDFSAGGLNILTVGDAGGNTGITFPAAAAQTYTDTGDHKASTAANWTSRVPLVGIDDVTIGATITYDMPRMGKSITFTGTPTVTVSLNYHIFGSLTMAAGMTYTNPSYYEYFRGRDSYTLTSAGETFYDILIYAPSGTLTLQDNLLVANGIHSAYGTFTTNDQDITANYFEHSPLTEGTRIINLGSSTVTLQHTGAVDKWRETGSIVGITLNAGTSTIILTNSGVNAQVFEGGGLTYNNVTVTGAGNYALTITGDNTFTLIDIDASSAAKTVKFTDASTTTVGDVIRDENGTNIITLTGTSTAGWNIVKSGAGVIYLDYVDISYSQAS